MPETQPTLRFSVSTRSSGGIGAAGFDRIAAATGLVGVDVDPGLDGRRVHLPGRSVRIPNRATSLWIPPSLTDQQVHLLAERLAVLPSAPTVIIDAPRSTDSRARAQITTAARLRKRFGSKLPLAIAIRPWRFGPTREHLNGLASLQMQAGEWEISIVVDLARELDWTWEAEAAITRIAPSLSLVRVRYPTNAIDGRFRDSLTTRTLASAIDLRAATDIALVTPVSWRYRRNERAVAAACRGAMLDLTRRFHVGRPDHDAIDVPGRVRNRNPSVN